MRGTSEKEGGRSNRVFFHKLFLQRRGGRVGTGSRMTKSCEREMKVLVGKMLWAIDLEVPIEPEQCEPHTLLAQTGDPDGSRD